jgi:hypothetical protein
MQFGFWRRKGTCGWPLVTFKSVLQGTKRGSIVGFEEWLVTVIRAMYEGVTTAVKIKDGESDGFEVKVAVHQGSVLSSIVHRGHGTSLQLVPCRVAMVAVLCR